jgi:Mrp family chromosome partitioning ATPase
MLATVFGVTSSRNGFADVFVRESRDEAALARVPGHGDLLRLLPATPEHAQLVDMLDSPKVERAIAWLEQTADVVLIDSPALTEVSDALTLADAVEAVLIAVRLGHTRRDKLQELRRLLAQRGVAPLGFVVTTRERPRRYAYYGPVEAADASGLRQGGDGAQPHHEAKERAPLRP